MPPSAPGHPRHSDVDADPIGANARLGRYTNFVNLLGWCALALPASFTGNGLAFGVTFIAPGGHDAALARFGMYWQAHVDLSLGATARRLASAAAGEVDAKVWPASEETLAIVVVGAHLRGLPLNPQLLALGAHFCAATHTAPRYRLFALPDTTPPKPGLLRVGEGGASIEVEVWALPSARVGAFLASVAAPLGLGSIELLDGRRVHGFLCESHALVDARDITVHGGWRAYLASLASSAEAAHDA